MRIFIIFLSLVLTLPLCAKEDKNAPPRRVPKHLISRFTQNREIPIVYFYLDSRSSGRVFTKEMVDGFIQDAKNRSQKYYGQTDAFLYQALDALAGEIRGKKVLVIGSEQPWYEAVLLSYGAHPIVVEYNTIECNDERIVYMAPKEWEERQEKVDFVLSISSTEHDGLGRYGDPVDPDGDLKSMENFKRYLKRSGKLIFAVPVGKDTLVWNAHRVYGRKRLPKLFKGWRPVQYYGFSSNDLERDTPRSPLQPVFVLELK